MRKRQIVLDIIRNIFERDWYTPYSQRSKKWKCGWIATADIGDRKRPQVRPQARPQSTDGKKFVVPQKNVVDREVDGEVDAENG